MQLKEEVHEIVGFRRLKAILFLFCAALTACATVNPKLLDPKVPTYGDGLRFYEMRPFVLVQKPFPIWARSILVDAQISDDGRNAKIVGSVPADFIPAFFMSSTKVMSTQTITAVTAVQKSRPPSAQSGEDTVTKPPTTAPTAPATPPTAAGDATTNKSGSGSIFYQVDKDGTPIVPVNDLFSIIFLPDYKREYVVDMHSRFGFAKIQVKTAPGGGLLAFNGDVDNSLLIKPLVDLYTTLVKTGGAVAEAAIDPHGAAVNALTGKAFAQTADTTVKEVGSKLTPGSTVTLRLTLIRFATPGPHPILKPGEHGSTIDAASGVVSEDTNTNPAPYEVDYRYFLVPIAEALLDSPSILALATSGKSDKPSESPGSGKSCSDKKMLAVSAATTLAVGKILVAANADLKVSAATVANADLDKCVAELDVTATTGDPPAAFTDPDGGVAKAFTAKYPNTKLVFK